jgi:hypothetical protein
VLPQSSFEGTKKGSGLVKNGVQRRHSIATRKAVRLQRMRHHVRSGYADVDIWLPISVSTWISVIE